MARTRPIGDPIRLTAEDDRSVTIQKVYTPRGERLQLDATGTGESIRLDAVALESVTWQEPAFLAERADSVDRSSPSDAAVSDRSGDAPFEPTGDSVSDPADIAMELNVANEYGQAVVERVGDGVTIRAPKLGHEITVGVDELEWITTQDHETFTEFLEEPFGPEDEHHPH